MPFTRCSACNQPIETEKQTYGDLGNYVCWECHCELQRQMENCYPIYGVAPHWHKMSKTGNFLGSTIPIALPDTEEDGWIDLELVNGWKGMGFKPDPECPGLGTYDLLSKVRGG